jgi:GTP cyclohydrolase I
MWVDNFFLRGMKEIDGRLFIALSKKFVKDIHEKTARHCLILVYDLETQSICDEHFLNLNKAILDIA